MWTKVTLQTVEPQDHIPELSGFVRHPKTLERCPVFHNCRRRSFGVLKREEINDRPIFNFPEDGLLRAGLFPNLALAQCSWRKRDEA